MPIRTILAFTMIAVAPLAAGAQTVTITQASCAQLTRHVPATDVEYKPGVDVSGRKVMPADLDSGPRIEMPTSFNIPISVEIAKRFGIPAVADLYKPEALIGTVAYRDGRFWFNDQPLQDEGQAALADLCQRLPRR